MGRCPRDEVVEEVAILLASSRGLINLPAALCSTFQADLILFDFCKTSDKETT